MLRENAGDRALHSGLPGLYAGPRAEAQPVRQPHHVAGVQDLRGHDHFRHPDRPAGAAPGGSGGAGGRGGDRFEYETNMLLAFKEKAIPFEENKIRTVYIEENKSSHFRTFVDSWRIYKLILAHFFRYTINSIVCAVVDTGLFTLFTALLKRRWRASSSPQRQARAQE